MTGEGDPDVRVLLEILKSVNKTGAWVRFMGILIIIALVLGGCTVLMGLGTLGHH
jgi:hypothetical protein